MQSSTSTTYKSLKLQELEKCNISELGEIRKGLLEIGDSNLIIVVDSLIRQKADEIMPHNKVNNKSYIKIYKENKKQEKQRKRTKCKRRR